MKKKSVPLVKFCGCPWNEECSCSPPEVLEANQKMWAERFAELNRKKREGKKLRLAQKQEQEQQRRPKEPEPDFDLDFGPIGGP